MSLLSPGQGLLGVKVLLREFVVEDITDAYLGWLNDSETMRYSNQRFRRHTTDTGLAYFRSFSGSSNVFIAICDRLHGPIVGTMTAYVSLPHGTADIGILIGDKSLWGKGYGLDAWRTLMDRLLKSDKIRKITAGTLRCNKAMVRIMERSGMELEAVRREQEIVEGQMQDVLYYAKFRSR